MTTARSEIERLAHIIEDASDWMHTPTRIRAIGSCLDDLRRLAVTLDGIRLVDVTTIHDGSPVYVLAGRILEQ